MLLHCFAIQIDEALTSISKQADSKFQQLKSNRNKVRQHEGAIDDYLTGGPGLWGSSACHMLRIRKIRHVTRRRKNTNLAAPAAATEKPPNPTSAINRRIRAKLNIKSESNLAITVGVS
jgi:hypothetical protein